MTTSNSLYLHIGMGKTGTTTLQHFLFQNRRRLEQCGIDYPDYNVIEGAHHRLSPHIPPFLSDAWKFIDPVDWAQDLQKRNKGRILLSSELISSARPPVVAEFADKIRPVFDVKIIIYLRRQDRLISSAYNQQIKAGTLTSSFDVMLERQFPNFNFLEKLDPWVDAFGIENVFVVPYERGQFSNGDIRKDFLERIFGIDNFSGFKFEELERNPALAYGAAEFKRLINCIIRDTKVSSKFNPVLQAYSDCPDGAGKHAKLDPCPPEVRSQILKRSEEANSTIAKDFLHRPDGRLFYDTEPTHVTGDHTYPINPGLTDDELLHIVRFINAREPKLLALLRRWCEKAAQENHFESYHQRRRLEFGMAATEKNESAAEREALSVPTDGNAPSYRFKLGSAQNGPIEWISDDEFKLDGYTFTIDLTPGSKRRVSDKNNFTIVKTRKFLGAYVDIPLQQSANILELGIFQGGSLAFMDRLYKPKKIVGIDFNREPVSALETYKNSHPSVATYYGVSQDDNAALSKIFANEFQGKIDLVVDDASHLYEQTKKSFEIIFPHLKHGGFYVIEDWAWSFKPPHQSMTSSWYRKPAMANLVFQIIGDIACNNAIENIFIQENLVIIRKSTATGSTPPFVKQNYRGRDVRLI